jgi:hypothetical protein
VKLTKNYSDDVRKIKEFKNEKDSYSYFFKIIDKEELFIFKESIDTIEGKNVNFKKEKLNILKISKKISKKNNIFV